MNVVRQLYQLQETEQEIDLLEKEARELEERLSQNEDVIRAEEALRMKQERLEETRKLARQIDWEIEDLQHKLASSQRELYSGRTGNPKELLSRQQDVAALRGRQEQLETRALELMEELERAEKEAVAAVGELGRTRANKLAVNLTLSKELEDRNAEVAALKAQRQRLVAAISSDAVSHYYRVKSLKAVAVAKIERGICGGCRISLSAREIQEARGNRLVVCGSCGRLLFMP